MEGGTRVRLRRNDWLTMSQKQGEHLAQLAPVVSDLPANETRRSTPCSGLSSRTILAAELLWYFLGKGCNNNTATSTGADTTAVAPTDTLTTVPQTPPAPAVKTLAEVTLPNGTKLQAYPGGIEDQLIQFIQSDEYKNATDSTLKEKWFNFDDLNFEFGTTKLTDSSKRQLDNIAAILKAFPDVKIKVGGYTDKKGDDAANLKLSDGRAKAVQAALKAAGVGAQVPQAEGYGETLAKVDENAPDEARAADRRTSVRLLKK